jgi:hypothetical protein
MARAIPSSARESTSDATFQNMQQVSTATSDANGDFTIVNKLNPKLLITAEKPAIVRSRTRKSKAAPAPSRCHSSAI